MLATLYPNQLGAYEMICSLCTCRQNSLKKITYTLPSLGMGHIFHPLGERMSERQSYTCYTKPQLKNKSDLP